SNVPVSKRSRWASPCSNVAGSGLAACRLVASPIIEVLKSTPTARPPGTTRAATSRVWSPVPQPRSRTASPGPSSSRASRSARAAITSGAVWTRSMRLMKTPGSSRASTVVNIPMWSTLGIALSFRAERGATAPAERYSSEGDEFDRFGVFEAPTRLGTSPGHDHVPRFKRQAPSMSRTDESGDALDDVARIHPAVDRLRRLVASATLLDMKATTAPYWSRRLPPARRDGEGGVPRPKTA